MSNRALLTRQFAARDIEFLRTNAPEWEFVIPNSFDPGELLRLARTGIDVFIGTPPSATVIDGALPRLKLMQIPWSGLDSVDLSECENHSVVVANSHGNAYAVAEMAFALTMAALKSIPFHHGDMGLGEWHRPGSKAGFHPPRLLQGLTIGYFGFGQINQQLDRLLSGFNVNKIAICRTGRENSFPLLPFSEFAEFLDRSDVVCIAAPLTPDTAGAFDAAALERLGPRSILINVARSEIVNSDALADALLTGTIAGAATDVWDNEPTVGQTGNSVNVNLLDHPRFVASPHRAGFSEGELPHLRDVIQNLWNVANEHQPSNIVDPLQGY